MKKLKYPDTSWQQLLKGGFCFGMLAPFASHPCDSERAIEMFYKAKAQNVGLNEILSEAKKYLEAKYKNKEDIKEQMNNVETFCKKMNKFSKVKKKAWLITWEDKNNSTFYPDNVIAIMDSRISASKIVDFIEQYYISNSYSLENKFYFSFRQKLNPYPALYSETSENIPYEGDIKCGENPYIHARIVKNLKLNQDNFTEKLEWEDIDSKSF